MKKNSSAKTARMPRLFILDSSVLIHDPASLFRFHEHDIFIPMPVLEELDAAKKGASEAARNARQASRFLDELVKNTTSADIKTGLKLNNSFILGNGGTELYDSNGRLFFQTQDFTVKLPKALPSSKADHSILAIALALMEQSSDKHIILVSKDINLRVKANVLGIKAEDYYSDQALEDVNLLPTGISELKADFWENHSKEMESWQKAGRTFYRLQGPEIVNWSPNQCLHLKTELEFHAIVRSIDTNGAVIEQAKDYTKASHAVWGINARNMGQNFALNLLMDPDVDFVSLLGIAGTGKTLLALAAGLAQTMEQNYYREIIMTRVTIPVGEDIGFLPGTEEEKMTPWMGALMDNLEVLSGAENNHHGWEQAATNDLLRHRIKIRSLNFMRGRTFLNRYIILDEAQNLTPKQMKTLITRAGPGTKIVCLGNISQIDTPYLTETTSGLTYIVDRFKKWAHSGHITLSRGERSRLADFASENL